ncbi:VOC family protein [uncultured Kordia sp.]|uniref:VOC family protein n=1 Tax=uncultured Kordia sp. TaxID=507699 RepID=UPI002635B313|nr:VOC family protein [uncultured Kordia sp.]
MKNFDIQSIRPFIGAKDYELSRSFYRDLGFEEIVILPNLSYFHMGDFGFYLQDAYVKDWIDNSMVFMEVKELQKHFEHVKSLQLDVKYQNVRLKEIVHNNWGNVFFIYDPSGILWQIGEFVKR